jgi:hypothetical protein
LSLLVAVAEKNRNPTSAQLFGALKMTGLLSDLIMKHPEVKNGMESFVMQHVTPILAGPQPREGWLRAMALELLASVAKSGLQYTNEEVGFVFVTVPPVCVLIFFLSFFILMGRRRLIYPPACPYRISGGTSKLWLRRWMIVISQLGSMLRLR